MRCEQAEVEVLEPKPCHGSPERPGQVRRIPCVDHRRLIEIEDLVMEPNPAMAGCDYVACPLGLHAEGDDNPKAVLCRLRVDWS